MRLVLYIYIYIQNNVQYRTNYNTLKCLCTAALYDTHTHAQYTQKYHVCYRLLRFVQHFVFAYQIALRRHSAATCLPGLRVRIPLTACITLSCDCCVFSGSCKCDRPILRPGKSNWVCVCFFVTDFYRPHRTELCICLLLLICTFLSAPQPVCL